MHGARIPSLKGVGRGDAAAAHDRQVAYALQVYEGANPVEMRLSGS